MYRSITIAPSNPCPQCGRELQTVQSSDNNSPDGDIQFDCLSCGYRFSYVALPAPDLHCADRTNHHVALTEQKSEVKSLYCEFCDKHFNQSSALKRHLIVHSLDRPFCCDECDKSFKTKAALKRHSIIHTGECPFECSTCKRRFNQISNLRKHLVIHNNNCPFYCSICGKGFNQLSNLKKHSVVHREYVDTEDSDRRPDEPVIPKVSERSPSRPVLTFVKPAKS